MYPIYSDLADKVVFITGGGSGIGAACVRGFIEAGSKVGFVSLNEQRGVDLCDSIEREFGNKPFFIAADIVDIGQLKQSMNSVIDRYGDIDILINNAANDFRHSLGEMSVEEWDKSLNINLRPHFFSAQQVAESMKTRGTGAIIQMGSNSALLGLSGYPAYVTAKAGIIGLAKALARELGESGIRVNTLIPGWVMTAKQKQLWVTEEALQDCLKQQCLKDTITERDIVNAALFLASDAARMITGQSIIVDGGRL